MPDGLRAIGGKFVALEHDGSQPCLQPLFLALGQGVAANEIALGHVGAKAQPGLEQVVRRGHVGAPVNVAFLESQRVERFVAGGADALRLAKLEQRVPNGTGIVVGEVQFPAQFAYVADALRPGRFAGDGDLPRGEVGEGVVAEAVIGRLAKRIARGRPPQADAGQFVGHVPQLNRAVSRRVRTNPLEIVREKRRAGDDAESVGGQSANGEVTLDTAACVEELRIDERAVGAVDVVAGDALQHAKRAGAADLEFAERCHVEQRGALAGGEAFLADQVVIRRAAPAPVVLVVRRLSGRLAGPEKVDAFPAVFLAELRAEAGEPVVKRALPLVARPEGFVGREMLVVIVVVHLACFLGDEAGVAVVRAEAANVHLVQVERRLAIDDPLGHHLADAARPGDAVERHAGRNKKTGHARHGAKAVLAVRRDGVRAVDELDDLGAFDQRDAPERPLHHRLEQFPIFRQ